jgi:hypothetical protein
MDFLQVKRRREALYHEKQRQDRGFLENKQYHLRHREGVLFGQIERLQEKSFFPLQPRQL